MGGIFAGWNFRGWNFPGTEFCACVLFQRLEITTENCSKCNVIIKRVTLTLKNLSRIVSRRETGMSAPQYILSYLFSGGTMLKQLPEKIKQKVKQPYRICFYSILGYIMPL